MLSLLLAIFPKCNAFQSTTIFRLPTPRKPPKSITAARTEPPRSTMTSTIRPISSSAALRTSRPSTPWASAARMMVTEGGGTASFDGTAGAAIGGGASRPACGEAVSSAARDIAAVDATTATAINIDRRFARIRTPEALDRRALIDLRMPDPSSAKSLDFQVEHNGARDQAGSTPIVRAINARERWTPGSGRAYAKLQATRHRRGDGPGDRRSRDQVAGRAGTPR